MCASTGYTWDQVGQLTIPRLKALMRYWGEHPPAHILLAAYIGYKPPAKGGTPVHNEALDAIAATAPVITAPPKLDTSAWENRVKKGQ